MTLSPEILRLTERLEEAPFEALDALAEACALFATEQEISARALQRVANETTDELVVIETGLAAARSAGAAEAFLTVSEALTTVLASRAAEASQTRDSVPVDESVFTHFGPEAEDAPEVEDERTRLVTYAYFTYHGVPRVVRDIEWALDNSYVTGYETVRGDEERPAALAPYKRYSFSKIHGYTERNYHEVIEGARS